MAKKNKRPTGFSDVTCNKCGAHAHAPKDTVHRWCKGDKSKRRTNTSQRGKWQ